MNRREVITLLNATFGTEGRILGPIDEKFGHQSTKSDALRL